MFSKASAQNIFYHYYYYYYYCVYYHYWCFLNIQSWALSKQKKTTTPIHAYINAGCCFLLLFTCVAQNSVIYSDSVLIVACLLRKDTLVYCRFLNTSRNFCSFLKDEISGLEERLAKLRETEADLTEAIQKEENKMESVQNRFIPQQRRLDKQKHEIEAREKALQEEFVSWIIKLLENVYFFCIAKQPLGGDKLNMIVLFIRKKSLFTHGLFVAVLDHAYTPYSKMVANKLFFCLHVN